MSKGNGHSRPHPEYVSHSHMPEAHGVGVSKRVIVGLLAVTGLAAGGLYSIVDAVSEHYHQTSIDPGWDAGGLSTPTPGARPEVTDTHPVPEHMTKAADAQLKRLQQYEKQFKYGVDSNILRTGMPRNAEQAQAQAKDMAAELKKYKQQGIKPVVFMEARTNDSHQTPFDPATLNDKKHAGQYHDAISTYFQDLANDGISSEDMGTWYPMPGPNMPGGPDHKVTDPDVYKRNVIPVAQKIKEHFRDAQVGVYVDAAQPSADYVYGVPEGLIDAVAGGGFPDSPNADPAKYLPVSNLLDTAQTAGAKTVMFNTGTAAEFRQSNGSYTPSTSAERGTQMAGVFNEAQGLQKQGFSVRVNFVVENDKPSGNDWGYHSPADVNLMQNALGLATQADIPVTFYEQPH